MSVGPLEGVLVLDCSDGPTGWRATSLYADYGATVLWLEPPGGAPGRARFAVESAVFNRGKRSVIIDPDRGGHDALRALLSAADVLVQDSAPSVVEELLADGPALATAFPQLVHCSITGMLAADRRAASESIVHAMLGTTAEQLGHRGGPIYQGIPFASIGASYLAVIGTLAALYRRDEAGAGRRVQTSLLEGALAYLSMFWSEADSEQAQLAAQARSSNSGGLRGTRLITGSFLCADGDYIGVHTGAVGAFDRLIRALGLAHRIRPSGSGAEMGIPLDPEEYRILDSQIHKIFGSAPRDVWVERLAAADVCAIPQLYPGEVFDEPQARHNNMVEQVTDPVFGLMDQVGLPIKFSRTPGGVGGPAPWPGQHTAEVRGWPAGKPRRAPAAPVEQVPLLDGVRVLDLGAYFAGPFSSRLLAGLGADVIKVEPPAGDPLRGIGSLFRPAQAGKRSIAMDLRNPSTQPALHQLIGWADVIHHNMRPGAAERLGVSYSDARKLNPQIVYGYAPGWGSTGPLANRQSFEPMMSGFVGAGFEAAGRFNPPVYPLGNADPGNGLLGAVATLMALLCRQRSGQGQLFEHPQLNATMTHVAHIARTADGRVVGSEKLDSLQLGRGPLDRLYETGDGWLCIAVDEDQLDAFGTVIGLDILADDRFYSAADRETHEYTLAELIASLLASRPTGYWLEQFGANGISAAEPSGPNRQRFLRDPDNQRLGLIAQVEHPTLGWVREPTCTVRVDDGPNPQHRVAPGLGEHTDQILTELGMAGSVIEDLRGRGAIV